MAQGLDAVADFPKKATHDFARTTERSAWLVTKSKVMQQVILNRLVNQGLHIREEEQAGFRPQRPTTEQIFILRLLVESIFNKAFDRDET